MTANLETARRLAQAGRIDEAERAFGAVLNNDPACLEAYSFLVMAAHRRRDHRRAIMLLERALKVAPEDSRFLTDLGQIHRGRNHLDRAADAFRRAIVSAPENYEARLFLGGVLERLGRKIDAVKTYLGALETARLQGAWTSAATIPPQLRAEIAHASDTVKHGLSGHYAETLAPLRAKFGASALTRVEKFLSIYLGEIAAGIPDARQKPLYFYFPDIPSQPYFTRDQVPWVAALEEATEVIRDEAATVVAGGELPPFLAGTDTTKISSYLSGGTRPPAWDAFFFYRDGVKVEDSHRRAPKTAEVLERLPLVRIPGSAPEICYSLLTPGTIIERHSGVANFRIVVHLPLIVPEGCAIRVGGEEHVWQEGRCVAFDDTFEHEAWNKNDQWLRVVMLMDAWNPHLTEAERAAVADLVGAIGGVNREAVGTPA